jgi:hypothetical protein
MNVQRDDGRGNQEKKIHQRISGDGSDKKTHRPEGIGRGDIRIVRQKGLRYFGLNKDREEFGGICRDDNEFIPSTVKSIAEGGQRVEM